MKKLESILKAILLRILLFFNPAKKNFTEPDFEHTINVLFIRLNRIGDALVSTPLFTQVKQNPNIKNFVLADIKNHFIFRNNPAIDEVIVFEKGIKGFFSINKIIKKNNIKIIVDLHDDVSTTVSFLVAIAKVQFKFGFEKSNKKIYTQTVKRPDPKTTHVIDRLMALLKLFKLSFSSRSVSVNYYPTNQEIETANELIRKLNPDNKYLIGINISAGSEARFWGIENYKKLFALLLISEAKLLLFASENEHHLCEQITGKENIYPLNASFGIFASGIMKMDFIITPDTSVVHLASINKIPLFGLYVKYQTDDMIWSPYNTDFDYVLTEEPTLKDIPFEEVKEKLIPFLETHLNVKSNS